MSNILHFPAAEKCHTNNFALPGLALPLHSWSSRVQPPQSPEIQEKHYYFLSVVSWFFLSLYLLNLASFSVNRYQIWTFSNAFLQLFHLKTVPGCFNLAPSYWSKWRYDDISIKSLTNIFSITLLCCDSLLLCTWKEPRPNSMYSLAATPVFSGRKANTV